MTKITVLAAFSLEDVPNFAFTACVFFFGARLNVFLHLLSRLSCRVHGRLARFSRLPVATHLPSLFTFPEPLRRHLTFLVVTPSLPPLLVLQPTCEKAEQRRLRIGV